MFPTDIAFALAPWDKYSFKGYRLYIYMTVFYRYCLSYLHGKDTDLRDSDYRLT